MTAPPRSELAQILTLAWPIALAQAAVVALGLVDVAVLGRVSVSDLAGASIGRSIGFVALGIPIGVAAALEPIASQAVGAGESRRAWMGFWAATQGCFVAWLPCMMIAFASTRLLRPFGIEADVADRARDYLVGHAPGLLCFSVFLAQKAYMQAHRRALPLLASAVIANVVNWFACNLLIRGDAFLQSLGLPAAGLAPMGALGAGIASSIASFVLLLATFPWMYALEREQKRGLGAPVSVRQVLALGAPIGLQLVAEIGVFSAVALLAGRFGSTVVSAHQVAIGLASFTFMGALGIGSATSVRVGHAVGEGRSPRRAGFSGIGIGVGYMLCTAVLFALFPGALVRLFTSDPEVIRIGTDLVRLAAIFQVFDGIQGVTAGALRGTGDVRFAFVANVVAHWFIGVPVALLVGVHWNQGARGLWLGLTSGLMVIAAALLARFAVVSRRAITRI